MGAQGGQLPRQLGPNVDPMGDLRTRGPGLVELGRVEARRREPCSAGQAHGPHDGLAGKRRLEEPRWTRAEGLRGAHGTVDLHMVRMPVSTRRVVPDEDVRALLVADGGDASADLEPADVGEAVGVLGVQAGVGIAEGHRAMHPEDAR